VGKRTTNIWRWLAIVALLASSAGAQQKIDWLVVPGLRVGPIMATTTRADLDVLFGKENVRDGSYEGGEAPEAATVIFGTETGAALAVTWDREHPAAIHVCFGTQTGPCRWRTASGIRIGLPIRELNRLNAKPFQLAGFAEERGQVVSWRKGALEEDPTACGHLVVRLLPAAQVEGRELTKDEANNLKSLKGDKPYSSTYLTVLDLNPIVSGMTLEFAGAACAK